MLYKVMYESDLKGKQSQTISRGLSFHDAFNLATLLQADDYLSMGNKIPTFTVQPYMEMKDNDTKY